MGTLEVGIGGRPSRAALLALGSVAAATLLAGCVGGGPGADPAGAAPETAASGQVGELAAWWNGTLETTVCHPSGIGQCTYYGIVGSPHDERDIGDLQPARRVNATLDWEPASRFTEELRFGIYETSSCGERCTHFSPVEELQGEPPLEVSANEVANGSYVAVVAAPDQGPDQARMKVVVEQPFQVRFTATPADGG